MRRAALAAAATAALTGAASLVAAPAVTTPARYVVVAQDAGGQLTPLWETRVRLALPARTSVNGPAVAAAAGEAAVEASVVDATGAVRFRQVVRPSAWLRGEFAGRGGAVAPIDGHLLPSDSSTFVVRVPEIPGTRVMLRHPGAVPVALPAVVPGARVLEAASPLVDVIQSSGSPANRLDVLIVAEGYTAAEHDAFLSDANGMLASFFQVSPYAEYRGMLNVSALFVASAQAGADHPPYRSTCPQTDLTCCSDADAIADPLAGTFVDTAFDGRYCTLGIQRLLTVDDAKVLVAAAAAPDWDIILVLVNDPTYGGSGGDVAVVSTDERATQIAQHELGHSFSLLADEYGDPYPGYPACSDVLPLAPCEANVTDEVSRDLVKWSPWILPDTPLPTPELPAYAGAVGLFEGARYHEAGMYRPQQHCRMRELASPFCAVCRQSFVLRLYRGGWGTPAAGIDPIDPGSETPPAGAVGAAAGEPLELAARLLRPDATPSLAVTWLLDGEPIAGADGDALVWTPPHPGTFRVELVVRDATGFVDAATGTPESRREWDVTAWSGRHPRRRLYSRALSP